MTKVGICPMCDAVKWLKLSGVCKECGEEIKQIVRDDNASN